MFVLWLFPLLVTSTTDLAEKKKDYGACYHQEPEKQQEIAARVRACI